jgi:hypothetical protein
MENEILWSWDSSHPDTENIQLPLSITTEKVISITVLTIMLGIFLAYISPMLGNWSYFLFILIYLGLIPYTLKNYKTTKESRAKEYISISKNEIKVNYWGYFGTYPLSNIDISSIKIKYIIVSTGAGGGHLGFNKGLCFKTISPVMHVKIPLPLVKPGLSKIREAIDLLTCHSSGTTKNQVIP